MQILNRKLFTEYVMIRLLIVLLVLIFPATSSAQSIQQQLLEEIQAVPDGLVGQWTIGGKQFKVDARNIVDQRAPSEVGSLAAILFTERGGHNVALKIQPFPFKVTDLDDGPYVFWKDASTAEVVSLVDGKVKRETHDNIAAPTEVDVAGCVESRITLIPEKPRSPVSAWQAPARLLAISDLEGHYPNVVAFLQNNGVIDKQGHWAWGDGHLVLIGDLIDRGSQVTELMWLIRRLEREAHEAGGQVHYILGNHEAMVMAGDLRYIHLKYVFTSQRIGIPYDELFGETSEIGRWWRSKNAVQTIGDLLFVHGGYSPMLDEAGLDIDTLNARVRSGLAPAMPDGNSPGANPVGHQHGPFWYRGYFDEHAAIWGKATPEQIQRILDRHKAKHIVIGHTLVPHVGPLDETGQVIAIDTKWRDPAKGEGLLQEDGKLWRLDMNGQRSEISIGSSENLRGSSRR